MRPRVTRHLFVFALLLASVAGAADCPRIVAIGDLHGGYDALVTILRTTALVDDELRWSGGDTCLVQLGDMVDRGARSGEVLDLLRSLQEQAPERAFVVLGNHEVMNLIGDLRYVVPGEFMALAAEETDAERAAGLRAYLERLDGDTPEEAARDAFETTYPRGWFAHRRAFSADGRHGRWLLERPVVLVLGRTLFAHGGIDEKDAKRGVDDVNRSFLADLRRYLELRSELTAAGCVSILDSHREAFAAAGECARRSRTASGRTLDRAAVRAARELHDLRDAPINDPSSPIWNRELALADEAEHKRSLEKLLELLDVDRIVVAHTTARDHRIRARFDSRVYTIDTGAGPAYGGHVSALVIEADGTVNAQYPDGREQLALLRPRDADVETFLLEGTVVRMKDIGTGITRPKKLYLEHHGHEMKAAFKTVDRDLDRTTVRLRRAADHELSDRYQYERAAYLVDRALGLNLVPVVVLREVDGVRGAAIAWVSDAIDEKTRMERKLRPRNPRGWQQQLAIMRVFDALILNTDRNWGNQLHTTNGDWQLHLIDHSRSFRLASELPDWFTARPVSLPRSLERSLAALDEDSLTELLAGLVSRPRIRAMLKRRDKILAKIANDRRAWGDRVVYFD